MIDQVPPLSAAISFRLRRTIPLWRGHNWASYVDGSFVGNSSDGYFTWHAGDQGYTQEVDAVVTDANGLTHTGTTFVTACTGNQITC
jgi:hypothetical protein